MLLLPDAFPVISTPYVDGEPIYANFHVGQTLADVFGEDMPPNVCVYIGGHEVPRTLWPRVKPRAGVPVTVTVDMAGGGNKWVRTIAMIAVAILSAYTGGAAAAAYGAGWGAAAGAAVSIVGTMAVNALIPPAQPNLTTRNNQQFTQLSSLTGTSNNLNPYGVVPCVLGTAVFYPPHAALPYTEIAGSDQYMRLMLDMGEGDDLDVSDITIGGTAIDQFDDVEYEVTRTPTLYANDIYELAVGTALNDASDTDTRTTQTAVTEISLDLIATQGLFSVDSKGNSVTGTVVWMIEYRAAGSSDAWSNAASAAGLTSVGGLQVSGNGFSVTNAERATLRCSVRWKVPSGQYDVRVTRGATSYGDGAQDSAKFSKFTWSVLRSIDPRDPSNTGTLKLCIRIRATDQLQGVLRNVQCRVAQRIPTYDAEQGVWNEAAECTNAAWIALWLATRCPAVVRLLDSSRMDLDEWAAWASEDTAANAAIGRVMDDGKPLMDWMTEIMAAGRARLGMNAGKYAPVRDLAQTIPTQSVTPANAQGFTWSRSYEELPHAFRVAWTNPEADWQQDERIVYWDGYDETNATRFEPLDLTIVTDPDQVWKLARYHLAQLWLRPITYRWTMDIEHIACRRGKLVEASQPMLERGLAYGYLKDVDGATVTLDQPVTLQAGTTYAVRVRCDDGSQAQQNVTATNASTEAVTATDVVFGYGVDGTETELHLQDADGRLIAADAEVTSIHQTDWQGTVELSSEPRTNLCVNSQLTGMTAAGQKPPTVTNNATFFGHTGTSAVFVVTSGGNYGNSNSCVVTSNGVSTFQKTPGATVTAAVGLNLSRALVDDESILIMLRSNANFAEYQITASNCAGYVGKIGRVVLSGSDSRGNGFVAAYAQVTNSPIVVNMTSAEVEEGNATGAYIPTTDDPVTVPDYTVSESGEVTLGQAASKGAEYTWSGSGSIAHPATELTLAEALPGAKQGDLYVFGEAGTMTRPLIVQSIRPLSKDRAEIQAVDEAPEVLTADSATPPEFVSSINGKSWCEPPDPPVVSIRAGNSAPNNAGVIDVTTHVGAAPPSGIYRIPVWKRQYLGLGNGMM